MTSKKLSIIFIASLLVVVFLVPALITANNGTINQGNNPSQAGQGICNGIVNAAPRFLEKSERQAEKMDQKKERITNMIQERWEKNGNDKEENRSRWNENRTEHFIKLREKIQDSEGVDTEMFFEEAVVVAISARRAAIDEAINNFKQGLEQIKADRKEAIDDAKKAFNDAVVAAYQKAEDACDADEDPATILQNLKDDIRAAKDQYKEDIEEIDKLKDLAQQLIEERKAAFEVAIQEFKDAMAQAKADYIEATVDDESGDDEEDDEDDEDDDETNGEV